MYLSWNVVELESGNASTPEEILLKNGVSFVVVATHGTPTRYIAKIDGSISGLDLSLWNASLHSSEEAKQMILDNFIPYSGSIDSSMSLAALGILSSEDAERLIE